MTLGLGTSPSESSSSNAARGSSGGTSGKSVSSPCRRSFCCSWQRAQEKSSPARRFRRLYGVRIRSSTSNTASIPPSSTFEAHWATMPRSPDTSKPCRGSATGSWGERRLSPRTPRAEVKSARPIPGSAVTPRATPPFSSAGRARSNRYGGSSRAARCWLSSVHRGRGRARSSRRDSFHLCPPAFESCSSLREGRRCVPSRELLRRSCRVMTKGFSSSWRTSSPPRRAGGDAANEGSWSSTRSKSSSL